MDRRMLAIVMAAAATSLFVLVAVQTWTTAAALGLGPLTWRFFLSLVPVLVAPLVAAALLHRGRPRAAAAVLATLALLWLPVPASAVRLLTAGSSGPWAGGALLELAAYGTLALATALALHLGGAWPAPTRPTPLAAALAVAAVAGSVWPPVVVSGGGMADWALPLALTAARPGDAALLVVMTVVVAAVLGGGLALPGRDGALVVATAACILLVDHGANLLITSGDPDAVLAPGGWAGLIGTLGLLLGALPRLRDGDGTRRGQLLALDAETA